MGDRSTELRRYAPLALVLIAGLALRLWAMRWPPFPIDMNDWIAWGERMLSVGPSRFYSDEVFADYAPGYLYVLWLTAVIKNGLFPQAGLGSYYALYRLPPILCDLGLAALVFHVVDRAGRRINRPALPTLAAACIAFNPALIINSAVWSQIDVTFTLLIVLSVLWLLRDRPTAAVLSYVVAFLIKPQAISLAPVIGVVLLLRYPPRRWLTAAMSGIVLALIILLPFFGLLAVPRLIAQLSGSVETYPYTSLFTYNLWGIYGFWKDDRVALAAGLTLRSFGTLLYLIGLAYGVFLLVRQLRRSRDDEGTLWLFATYFTFLPVMVLTRMHERYLYPVFPFLLLFAFVEAQRRRTDRRIKPADALNLPFVLFLALTVLHTLNLYQVYTYYIYRMNYQAVVPETNTLYYFIDANGKWWSALTLLMFAAIALMLPGEMPRWRSFRPRPVNGY